MTKCAVPDCENDARPKGDSGRTCSPAHAKLWNEVYRFKAPNHKINQANTILRRPEKYSEARVKWAQRVIEK